MSILLEVTDLRKSYGRIEALRGVTFQVEEGELFGLLGPNGAGKTTLISILSCLAHSNGGQAKLDGKLIRTDDTDLRRFIGIVPQDLAVYGELTARENLAFFGNLYGMGGAALSSRVDEVLEAIALADRAGDRVSTFSGGMKRRLNLGVAILHHPRLLFLDEPTTGVDPQSRNRIFEEVRRLNKTGVTVVYTSHYMEEVQALCRRVGILDHGKLIACDTVHALLQRLDGQIEFEVDPVPADLPRRLGELADVRVEQIRAERFMVNTRAIPDTLMTLTAMFTELRMTPVFMEAHEPNLERVFLHLTGRALRD